MQKTQAIRQEVLLAAAVMTAFSEAHGDPKIEDISSLLYKLRSAGISLGEIALRRVPGGYYSEDIEALVGHYLAAGYATQRSPVKLTDEGRHALNEILNSEREENPKALEEIESVLGHLAA